MRKRKRAHGEHPLRKSPRLVEQSQRPPPFQHLRIPTAQTESRQALPSPSTSNPPSAFLDRTSPPTRGLKTAVHDPSHGEVLGQPQDSQTITGRKRKHEEILADSHHGRSKPKLTETADQETCSPRKLLDIEYWAEHGSWPETFLKCSSTKVPQSGGLHSLRLLNMSQDNSSKRRSESTHRSDKLERMADNGVFMKSSALVQKTSKDLCRTFLIGNRTPSSFPCFPAEKLSDVLERVDGLNEGRIQRDITPWVVPSAENLHLCGELDLDYIGDEVQAEWSRCATMGSTRPKPDYTAGLLRAAFSKEEIEKLRNYASPTRPFFFTPEVCFPFLACEAKSGEEGLNKANRQNIHSASIAVRTIIELFWSAFGKTHTRVKELYGKILFFTVSHNSSQANIYGHYAVINEVSGQLEFYRYDIAMFSLTMNDGADRYKSFNFVYNVFKKFAPEHLKRIQDATTRLSIPKIATSLSFTTSELELQADAEPSLHEASSQEHIGFRKPPLPANALHKKELEFLKEQMEQHRKQMEQQMEQQRQQMERQMEQQRQQMEQQRQQIEQQRQMMEQQRQQMERQMEQQRR